MASRFENITNQTELRFKIMQLNSLRAEQELALKRGMKELYASMHPVTLLRSTLSDLASDKQIQFDAGKIGLNLGLDFVIGKLLGSHMGIKKYLGSLLLNKASDYFLQKHPEKIAWSVNKLNKLLRTITQKKDKAEPK